VASTYARFNRFIHNEKKSAVMVFNANAAIRRRVAEEEWTLSGAKVEVKKQYKYLGVEIRKRKLGRIHREDHQKSAMALERPSVDPRTGERYASAFSVHSVAGHGSPRHGVCRGGMGW
jgi:hypothetical protein